MDYVPQYVSDVIDSNIRDFTVHSIDKQIFPATNVKQSKYNAYEKDVAMATFYFDTPTVFEYTTEERMTALGYISQMGGLLGLCLGISLISIVEVVYWFTIKIMRNLGAWILWDYNVRILNQTVNKITIF